LIWRLHVLFKHGLQFASIIPPLYMFNFIKHDETLYTINIELNQALNLGFAKVKLFIFLNVYSLLSTNNV